MMNHDDIPDDYDLHVITAVEHLGDSLMIRYDGRIFSGIMLDELPPGILESIRPGTKLIVRLHTAETGDAGQVAHMLIPHPSQDGWAEVYADY